MSVVKTNMAATGDSSQLCEKVSNLQINGENQPCEPPNDSPECAFPLADVYKLAVSFYREKEGKAVHFSYEDKLQLVAFTQQVLHGPLSEASDKIAPLGALDMVGKDRRLAWQKLGALSVDQARAGFVELLSRRCPLFTAYVEAHRREKVEQARRAKDEEKQRLVEEEERARKIEEERILQEQLSKEEAVKRQIQQALNEQTYEQFRKYAEQQFPGDPEKQGSLIRQLQDQHYIQYMQQLEVAQKSDSVKEEKTNPEYQQDESNSETEVALVPASMWTRSDVQAFKQNVSQAEGDGVVRVSHGETVTVRVPTHPQGARLFWEFATDYYDIGFGVYFEYGTPQSNQVSVHVSESDDEDIEDGDEEVYEDEDTFRHGDLEAGSVRVQTNSNKPLLTEIVPVYRRDCQNEVYAGSHQYPGQGVYLLKFDNSYSLWRSKTLYYRVYYTQ